MYTKHFNINLTPGEQRIWDYYAHYIELNSEPPMMTECAKALGTRKGDVQIFLLMMRAKGWMIKRRNYGRRSWIPANPDRDPAIEPYIRFLEKYERRKRKVKNP